MALVVGGSGTEVEPVDLRHLGEQTGGDAGLEREVLLLFVADAPIQVAKLRLAAGVDRRAIAHRLLGAAKAIGANEVARCAALIEAGGVDIDGLAAAVADVNRFVADRLSRAP